MLNIFKKQWPTGEQFKCLLFASIVSSDYCARLVEGRFKHRDLKQQPSEAGIFWRLFKENLEFHPVVLWYLGSDYFKTTRWESFEVYLGQVVEGYTYFLGPFGDRLAEWTGMKGLEIDLLSIFALSVVALVR